MKIVFDIEANGLHNPTEVWVVVCKDVQTCHRHVFRNLTRDEHERQRFLAFSKEVTCWIGHNILSYDLPVLHRLLGLPQPDVDICLDTFIISKLVDYPRSGHSVKDYGVEFNLYKGDWTDWSEYSQEMEDYCVRDVDITHRIYAKYRRYIDNPKHFRSILLEHQFQQLVDRLNERGFCLDIKKAQSLLLRVTKVLEELDKDIAEAFPPRLKLIKEITPKETKYGTISLTSIPKVMRDDIPVLSVGAPFSYCEWVEFNAGSPKQVVSILNEAGWRPENKTKGHIETERELNRLRRQREKPNEFALILKELYNKLSKLEKYGWKIDEHNLSTLPASAPAPARTLAKRILHESRRKTLTEWLTLVQDDGRVHGQFQGIGAWTHRMSHQKPNMANVTNEFDLNNNVKLLGKELRQCWIAPKNRLLVGCDAESIQLRIFAHYINDPEFTNALVSGKKSDKTDPHNLNQRILGNACKSRAAAKRFIFALLLGAGLGKLAEILDASTAAAEDALERLLERYTGFAKLKSEVIPADAERGWFSGLDGRRVRILGETVGARRHLAMSGYLQNGESVVIKTAAVIAEPEITKYDSFFVNIVHDEDQVETPNDMKIALKVAAILDESMQEAGKQLGLLCPIKGSYWNDDHEEYTIGRNWYETH